MNPTMNRPETNPETVTLLEALKALLDLTLDWRCPEVATHRYRTARDNAIAAVEKAEGDVS